MRFSATRWTAIGGVLLLVLAAWLSAGGIAGGAALAALLVAGAALVAVAAHRSGLGLRSLWRSRAARRGADSVVAVLLLTAVLVLVQAISLRHAAQVDLTRNRRNTLAPQTLALLASLDRDISATAFVRQTSVDRAGIIELLDLYARRSPRFRYRMVDPDRQPDLAARLNAGPGEIVLEAGDRRFTARNPGEESLTSALIHVTRDERKAVYFVTGHGEKSIESTDRDGYSAVKNGLEQQGYSPRSLSLIGGPVPGDAAVVVLAGPRADLLAEEANALSDYARAGGSFLVLIDPRTDLPRLASLLADYRLSVRNEVILDEKGLRAGDRTFDATVVKVRRYERHPITRGFNYVTMFPRARPVFVEPDSLVTGTTAQYLAISDDGSWGETDMETFSAGTAAREGKDIAGPLPVAAVATRKPFGIREATVSRLVLVGDSDFANNVFYGVLGNSDWFHNAVSFLAHDESLISIRPRVALADRVYLTEREGRLVFLVCIVLLPAACLGAGVVVIAKRARL